ncbi:hypothetical protein FRACYDRAFT_234103 [Fragilariopsis cylindrus CCMP1102]|uniref:Uncharacterized protein n=1 Tax=Fragilariopsis cylindrus CCMP1102 TaxID=635003 RepID=A0A1E7FQT5_9STRA|nr:hypothetical protein FRACYDRAFT_234103 [Fragilariopsis cylindrus CCMP1102]|eukprot:OEU20474.1 hypothetical protein FRACYDRAFT_234103 [Fragilariopsis cylindrus CCMP1102]
MLRRSLALLSKSTTNAPSKRRTIVRDPRKKVKNIPVAVTTSSSSTQNQSLPSILEEQRQHNEYSNKLKISSPFQPSTDNDIQPQSIASSLASYMLAGVGVAMGATLVGVLFGGL